MEHRWGNRASTDVDVQIFAHPASAGWGRLRDISISGGFIETALRVPLLSTLCMTVPASRHAGVRIVRAVAVRSNAAGVGVEWFDDDSDAVSALIQEATMTRTLGQIASEMRV